LKVPCAQHCADGKETSHMHSTADGKETSHMHSTADGKETSHMHSTADGKETSHVATTVLVILLIHTSAQQTLQN
jgi:hypothetical protein